MIVNDAELKVVREQMVRLERALESLSREVRPKNEALFRVMAEGYVDQLAELRREIDEYLGVAPILPGTAGAARAEGAIRQINLDENSFYLRERGPGLADVCCEYSELIEDKVKRSVGDRVRVKGCLRTSEKTGKQTLEVDEIEVVPDPAAQHV